MTRGSLIVLEGLDGTGKSTQLPRLAERLATCGHRVLRTAEPYDCAPGRRIREIAKSGAAVAPEQELALFLEQRRLHVRECIEPALARGEVVLSDRYFLSTVAYQGARGHSAQEILARSESEFPIPDLVLLLELPADRGLERVRRRGLSEPAFEQREYLEAVAEIFGSIERDYVERIDASADPAIVHERVWSSVRRRLSLPSAT